MSKSETILQSILEPADIRMNGNRPWDFRILHRGCAKRILSEGSLGLGESYMDGWWEVEKLDQFFERLLSHRLEEHVRAPRHCLAMLKARWFNQQSKRRSKKVADVHYNLGNHFYASMLDPWMQYTCAYWKDASNLAQAQEAKLHLVCRKLHLQPGEKVLELGGGWGGFARFAAEHYGVSVVSYNISTEQVKYARESCKGLPVEIREADYREATGVYDKAVSIGVCEHVGYKNYRDFLRLQKRCVKPNGLVFLHTIGCNQTKTSSDPWFTRYIFPGGQLPSQLQISRAAEDLLVLEDLHNIGPDYDLTLMAWYDNFCEHWDQFKAEYGERFFRMWKYYLMSCAGAFRARNIQLWQMVFSVNGVRGGYLPVR